MGDSRIKDISSLLSSFFDEGKLKRGERYSDFFSSWPDVVGSRLAAHSRVADVDKGLLVVEAEHPGWIQLLQIRQSSILEDISRRFPELGLRGIAFRLSGKGGPAGGEVKNAEKDIRAGNGTGEAAPGDSAGTDDSIGEESVNALEDPEFRALFSSLKKTIQGKS